MTEGPNNNQVKQAQQGETGHDRLLTAYEIYNNLVEGKVSDFETVKKYLSETLETLLKQGKIGSGVVLLSRIKSPASVVQNWKLKKNLNDIFGITLLTTTQDEMDEIRATLRKARKFNTSSKKEKNEKRGYEAIHFLFHVGDEECKKTMVECHLQTHEAYKNVYPHIFYKVRRRLNRDLTLEEEKQIEEKVQAMYESDELSGNQLSGGKKSRVPQMWLASFNQDGKMLEQELNETMILKIMYPSLDISKKKQKKSGQGRTEKTYQGKIKIPEELEQDEI